MPNQEDPLLVMITVIAPEGSSENLIGTIKPLIGSIRSRAGCINCHIYQDIHNPEEMALLQEWDSEAAFAAHVGSRDYRYILEWMEMSTTKPQFTICKRPDYKGFKLIRNLLNVAAERSKPAPAGKGGKR